MSSRHLVIVSSCHRVIVSLCHYVIIFVIIYVTMSSRLVANFWQILAAFDNFCQQLETFGNFWLLLAPFATFCQLSAIFVNFFCKFVPMFAIGFKLLAFFWQIVAIFWFLLLTTLDTCWHHLATFGKVWQCLPTFFLPFLISLATFGNFCHPVDVSYCHLYILSFCPFVILSVWQLFNLSAC